MTTVSYIRRPAVSGMFYPADPTTLRTQVDELLERYRPRSVKGKIHAIIAPHAGYMYSGAAAARSYAELAPEAYDVVVVVSPSHREYFNGVSIYPGTGYQTPLGKIPLDSVLREKLLRRYSSAHASEEGHREEHAIEVQLPFLQEALGSFSLLPIVIGNQHRDNCLGLGDALADVLRGERALLVASTDLSHYYPMKVANRIDQVMVDDLNRFDFEALMEDLEQGHTEACGGGPVVAVMAAAKKLGANRLEVLVHTNSGEVSGDQEAVVGYLSAVAYEQVVGEA